MYKTQGRCPTCGRAEKKTPRSIPQNNYYWGTILRMIAESTGNDSDDVHEELKRMYLKIGEKKLGDRIIDITKSTTELTTIEAEQYYTKIRAWASQPQINIHIPLPNEVPDAETN